MKPIQDLEQIRTEFTPIREQYHWTADDHIARIKQLQADVSFLLAVLLGTGAWGLDD